MPVFDLQDGKDLEAAIERMLGATNDAEALARLRAVFVESLDFEPANGVVSLDAAELPAQAHRIAQRDGVQVVAVILKEANVRAERCRTALTRVADILVGEIWLVAADANRDEWHFIYPPPTSRDVLRRMVVRRKEEGRRTVVEQLVGIYREARDGKDFREALRRAYDVEAVTRTFFQTYREAFNAVMAAVAPTLPDEAVRRLFSQRLFNRLLFIRFIEKKGWLQFGGERDYLYALWDDHRRNGGAVGNFYRDRLRPLFFDGLNKQPKQRPANITQLIGTMPYLNGGLFEESEDDRNAAIVVPDVVFEQIIQQDRTLGLLYRFNFTVTEATPLEVEVAVDPEMLGKVFEELVTGRQEIGSYYTPKPIVAFMAREALKGFLGSSAPVKQLVDDDNASAVTVPEARNLLIKLDNLRAVDPACGSGAYLLGLLQELLRIYQRLDTRVRRDPRSLFELKMEIIQRSLYGVDIDPFAVNIARLRLWLSLVVEYDADDPPPLPNLDFKIESGDSLTGSSPEDHVQLGLHKMLFDQYRTYAVERDTCQRVE